MLVRDENVGIGAFSTQQDLQPLTSSTKPSLSGLEGFFQPEFVQTALFRSLKSMAPVGVDQVPMLLIREYRPEKAIYRKSLGNWHVTA